MVTDSPDGSENSGGVNRRTLFAVGAATAVAGAGLGVGGALLTQTKPSTQLWPKPDRTGAPRVSGLHLQFGADASREVVASWSTPIDVHRPRVLFGTVPGGFGAVASADTTAYRDAQSGLEVWVHHARLTNLTPDTDYIYAAVHDGAAPELGTVRTAPSGRAPLRFTSFGDQSTPTLNAMVGGGFVSDNRGSPAAGDVTNGVERLAPLFNLINGDLCYANLSGDRIRTWANWFESNSRSTRYRPWMPAAGNHENELGNGPVGYGAYQTYFNVPDSGADSELRGLWYSFTAGSVRIISLNNDDICLQDGGNSYVFGYSAGAQQRWLETELAAARSDERIDWVVVCMHQTAVSTGGDGTNGADLGIRRDWLPLFDRYGVDLVVCGHEHHYERSHPVRGTLPTDTLTPAPVRGANDIIDTSRGTVHLVIGGGGTSIPSNRLLSPELRCRVLTAVGRFDPALGHKVPTYVQEDAPWSAFRDRENPYGFVCFDLDPGKLGGQTFIKATYYAVTGPMGDLVPIDEFTLTRPRTDHP